MKVYLASPLGFSELGRIAMVAVVARLEELGHEVLNPWDGDFSADIKAAMADGSPEAIRALEALISRENRVLIDRADALMGVVDGMEPDSGTCWEMGYAVGRGLPVYALRTDFRSAGDFGGLPFNLQLGEGLVAVFRAIADINF
jgi:nucleoside 2-deoxyribosyltransferase